MLFGGNALRTYSSVQNTIARSSGESELYAMLRAATHVKHIISIALDFGDKLDGTIMVDATAAIGITGRSGLAGRSRHI